MKTFDFLQDNLRILSGQYGILKPLDLMQAYRLEMGTRLKVGCKPNLYKFWDNQITDALNAELEEGELFVNLASNEYFKVLQPKVLKVPVITPVFKDFKNGEYKMIMTFANWPGDLWFVILLTIKLTDIDGSKGLIKWLWL